MAERDLKEQITRLNRIGIALSSETNLERLLSSVVSETRTFTGADAGSLYIREGDTLHFMVTQNDTLARRDSGFTERFRPYPVPLTWTSISGYAALSGETLNIPDVYELDPGARFSFNPEFDRRNDYRSQSMLVVPMFDHRHENIGVLQLINARNDHGLVMPFSRALEELVLSLASQAAVAIRNAQLIQAIKKIFAALVQYSASAIDARSPHTAGHSRRVAALSQMVAEAINRQKDGPFAGDYFTAEQMEELSYAAWLHDIGKIGVREQVLEKSGKLADDRLELIQTRFKALAMGIRLDSHQAILETYLSGSPNPQTQAELEADRDRCLAELDEDLKLILKLNIPGWVSDDDYARLKVVAAKEARTPEGETIRYLTEFEFENLAIRKGNLTKREYLEIQSHVLHTHNIIEKIPFTDELARIPLFAAAHHEMLNGTGYPHGLKGDQIPLQARILAVVDVFDALVAKDRPYKKAMPVGKALDILRDEVKVGRLDPEVVDIFINEKIASEDTVNALAQPPDHLETIAGARN